MAVPGRVSPKPQRARTPPRPAQAKPNPPPLLKKGFRRRLVFGMTQSAEVLYRDSRYLPPTVRYTSVLLCPFSTALKCLLQMTDSTNRYTIVKHSAEFRICPSGLHFEAPFCTGCLVYSIVVDPCSFSPMSFLVLYPAAS